MIVPPIQNDEQPIPPTPALTDPDRWPILHVQVQVRQNSGHKLRFASYVDPKGQPPKDTNVNDYVKMLARKPTVGPSRKSDNTTLGDYLNGILKAVVNPRRFHTPLDIIVGEICFIVIELDPTVNWEFTTESLGVTAKVNHPHFNAENGGVTYALGNKVIGPNDPGYSDGVPPGCRVLYWSVLSRKKRPPIPSADTDVLRGFNFYIDFIQRMGNEVHRMPTIFDPNVPNTGGSEFP
jgi:hypothetical protein